MEFGFPLRPTMPVLYRATPDAAPEQIKGQLSAGGAVCLVAAGFQPAETGRISCGSREFAIDAVSVGGDGFMTLYLRELAE